MKILIFLLGSGVALLMSIFFGSLVVLWRHDEYPEPIMFLFAWLFEAIAIGALLAHLA